jgi:hypothetical protein
MSPAILTDRAWDPRLPSFYKINVNQNKNGAD